MGYIPDPGARPDIDKVTENYELAVPIPEPAGGADIIAIWEENYEKIDDQLYLNNITKTDTGYLQGGILLGLTSLVSDTQYLAGDGFWYKLKSTTTSPYTHDASDTPDSDYLEKITHKTTLDKVESLIDFDSGGTADLTKFKIKFGEIASAGTTTFSTPFEAACLGVYITDSGSAGDSQGTWKLNDQTITTDSFYCWSYVVKGSSTPRAKYIAIGY